MMKNSMVLLLFCALSVQFACPSATTSSSTQSQTNMDTTPKRPGIEWSVIHAGNQCGIEEKKQIIVKTQREFDNLWKDSFQNMPEPVKKPVIDFSKDWVIAAFLGTVNNGGHSLAINDIEMSDDNVTVVLTHTKPGKNCASTMAIEFPYILARVEQFSPKGTPFKVTEKLVDCSE